MFVDSLFVFLLLLYPLRGLVLGGVKMVRGIWNLFLFLVGFYWLKYVPDPEPLALIGAGCRAARKAGRVLNR